MISSRLVLSIIACACRRAVGIAPGETVGLRPREAPDPYAKRDGVVGAGVASGWAGSLDDLKLALLVPALLTCGMISRPLIWTDCLRLVLVPAARKKNPSSGCPPTPGAALGASGLAGFSRLATAGACTRPVKGARNAVLARDSEAMIWPVYSDPSWSLIRI